MASTIRVDRRYHFSCSCGTTTVSGQSTVTCAGCGKSFSVRRVRKPQRIPGFSPYYGIALSAHQPETAEIESSSTCRPAQVCDFVRVARLKPDRITPHPHAGALGQVMDIFSGHAHIIVKKNGACYSICVSVSCLEVLRRAEWPQPRQFQPRRTPQSFWRQIQWHFAL